nr:pyrin domain-containing protein 1 isoform X1 [Zootoca vivipara]
MEKTITDSLMCTLENLREDELKKFKLKLHEFPVKKCWDNIPLGKLEKADVVDLSLLLLKFYTGDYAVQVTADVLRTINCRDEAERLLRHCRKGVPVQRSQRK